MNYSTGPPDWEGIFNGLVLVAVLYLAVFPFTYVLTELSVSNTAAVYIPHSA